MRTPSYYFVYKQDIRDIKREEQNLTLWAIGRREFVGWVPVRY